MTNVEIIDENQKIIKKIDIKQISLRLKQPLTFEEQLNKLIFEKNLIVDENEKKEVLEFLKKVNYYFISGYLIPYRYKTEDNIDCYKAVEFKKIKKIIEFDYELKEILYIIIAKIEKNLKTNIAYYFAHNYEYGNISYICPESFKFEGISDEEFENSDIKKIHNKLIEEINMMKRNNKKLPFIIHHEENYGGNIPIWAIIELFTLGNIEKFFEILNEKTKKDISNNYNIKPHILKNWIHYLRYFRNLVAHDQRLYNISVKTPKGIKIKSSEKIINFTTNYIFDYIRILNYLFLDREYWNKIIIIKLKNLFNKYKEIDIKDIGFNENWEEILKDEILI